MPLRSRRSLPSGRYALLAWVALIVSPGAGQNPALIDNASGANTLDNTATSTAPGASPSLTMDWSFQGVDEWQMVVPSLQAPGPRSSSARASLRCFDQRASMNVVK